MLNPNQYPIIYVIIQGAMERHCHEEGIPARRLPDLASNDEDVLEGARNFVRAVRRMLAPRWPVWRVSSLVHTLHTKGQLLAVIKSRVQPASEDVG